MFKDVTFLFNMNPRCHLALIASKKKHHMCPALPNEACRGRKKQKQKTSISGLFSFSFHEAAGK